MNGMEVGMPTILNLKRTTFKNVSKIFFYLEIVLKV